jgi:hypothetical protein
MEQKHSKPEAKTLEKLDSIEDMAVARFGSIEGLAIVKNTTLELAQFYAERFKLDATDPEVMLNTTALAFARHKEFCLLREIECDLFERVTTNPNGHSYGQVLFNTTRTGAYRDVYREVDRLHSRASGYLKELRELAKDARQS